MGSIHPAAKSGREVLFITDLLGELGHQHEVLVKGGRGAPRVAAAAGGWRHGELLGEKPPRRAARSLRLAVLGVAEAPRHGEWQQVRGGYHQRTAANLGASPAIRRQQLTPTVM